MARHTCVLGVRCSVRGLRSVWSKHSNAQRDTSWRSRAGSLINPEDTLMSGAMRKIGEYLGLVEDTGRYDEYDDEYDSHIAEGQAVQVQVAERSASRASGARDRASAPASVSDLSERRRAAAGSVAELSRITTLHPRTYNEARTVGENYREGTPVIMNLSEMDDADAKRLVDFAAGLVFATRGTIERITAKVFLLPRPTCTSPLRTSSGSPRAASSIRVESQCRILGQIIEGLLWSFLAFLWIRFVFDWVQVFARAGLHAGGSSCFSRSPTPSPIRRLRPCGGSSRRFASGGSRSTWLLCWCCGPRGCC